jgi:hypothetical protein
MTPAQRRDVDVPQAEGLAGSPEITMKPCSHYQAELLEYLYALLDPAEEQELVDHVKGCRACQQALTRAEGQKQLLAQAAKMSFPEVAFGVPALPVPAALEEHEAVVLHGPATWAWGRWAVAAAVLLTVGVLGMEYNAYWLEQSRASAAKQRIEASREQVAQLQQSYKSRQDQLKDELRKLQEMQGELDFQKLQQKAHQLAVATVTRPFHMTVSGPPAPEAGALNEYQIEIRNQSNQLALADVTAKLLDQDRGELASRIDVQPGPNPGHYKFALPRDLPLRPDSDLYLVLNARGPGGGKAEITEKLKLIAPVFLTHLATDKPMYQPGETVRFRSLTLERFSLKPARDELHLIFEITRPTGEQQIVLDGSARLKDEVTKTALVGPDKEPVRGVGAGEFVLPPDSPGGEYTLSVREAGGRFPPQQRKFIVNEYQKSELNKELDFSRKSYGPGEEVMAVAKVASAQGNEPVRGARATASLTVDGRRVGSQSGLTTNANGVARVRLKLPAQIERGIATVSVEFNDGAHVETITRPVPIVLKKLQIEFFPEGGDLVAGVLNHVYFQARTTLDKPAELSGHLVDEDGQVAATLQTLNDPNLPGVNQGMGRFEFVPKADKKYELKIDVPSGIEGNYPLLSPVKPDGVVLSVPTGVASDKDPIRVVLRNGPTNRRFLVGAYCRGRLMAHQRVEVAAGQATEIQLHPQDGVGGVYRITVFEELATGDKVQLAPRAERLVYRTPAHRLELKVQPDKPRYEPGERVTLRYQANDETGEPAPGVLMVAAVDKRLLTMADEKTFRSMPTHFLLTTEIRHPDDLEYADFLLGPNPKAHQALDLLLGTQGWRRFAEQTDPNDFRQKNPDDGTRLLAANGRVSPANFAAQRTDLDLQPIQQAFEEYRARRGALEDGRAKAEHEQQELRQEGERLNQTLVALQQESERDRQEYQARADQAQQLEAFARHALLPGLAVLLLVGGAVSLVVGLLRTRRGSLTPYLLTAACSLGLFGVVVAYQLRPGEAKLAEMEELPGAQVAMSPDAIFDAETVTRLGGQGEGGDRKAHGDRAFQKAPMKEEKGEVMEAAPAAAAMPRMKAGPGNAPPRPQQHAEFSKPGDPKADKAKALPATPPAPMNVNARQARGDKDAGQVFKRRNLAPGRMPQAEMPAGAADGKGRAMQMLGKKQADRRLEPEEQRRLRQAPAGPAGGMQAGFAPGLREAFLLDLRNGDQKKNRELAQFMQEPIPAPPLLVREYAHHRIPAESGVRSDATETIFWHPVLVLPDGKGESSFDLSDSVTTFQVLVAAHTLDGRLGALTTQIDARKSLTIEPKLPIEVTASDKIDVALAVANGTDGKLAVGIQVQPTNLNVIGNPGRARLALAPNGRGRLLYRVQPATVEGEAKLRFDGASGPVTDSVVRSFRVVPEGFPIVGTQSDILEKTARHELVLPDSWIPGTLRYEVAVYPSTLADLQKGLEALLREPNGCFEQTSTTNYPNLLILDYLRETDQAKPEVANRARELLDRGYQKLVSFECLNPSKNHREGYEWFGGTAPAHEALTAYGLLQFRDMARVYDVDRAMIERTRTYLMSRKDGKGGFLRNPRALDTFGRAPEAVTNAYIVWALTESGKDDDVNRELNALNEQAKTSKDPYFLALVGNSLLNRSRSGEALALLTTLVGLQKPDGHLDAAQTSITGSGGRDLQIETTALTVLAWIKAQRPDQFNVALQKAIKWIGQQRGGYGGFGSTQSTILTMKALIAYARANKKTAEAGELTLYVGDEPVVRQAFAAGVEQALVLKLPDAEKRLKPGKNELRVEITGKSVFPYTATWSYQSLKPASAARCAVGLTTTLDRETAVEGEPVSMTVRLANTSGKGQGMTVAIIGIPAGLTLPEDMKQLTDMARLRNNGTERGLIDAWETRGRELILYWRDLAPDKKIEVNLELICRVPGEYHGPASRAYLYYNADHKCWVEPLSMVIKPKAE